MKMVLALALAVLVFLSMGAPVQAMAEGNVSVAEQAESFPTQLPDMRTEAGIRAYLAGEWHFYDDAFPGNKACHMVIDEGLHAEFVFTSRITDEIIGTYGGQFSFDRVFAGAQEAPDLLCLELTDDTLLGGDFFFLHRTICDGSRILSLFSAGNGGCVFDLPDPFMFVEDESGWGYAPVEILLAKDTGEEYDPAPRQSAEFYAVCWGECGQENIWLDDIDWPPPGDYVLEEIGSDSWYRYLTTQYANEVPVSVAYVLPGDRAQAVGGDLRYGEVYLVHTDEHGKITNMRLASEE